MTSDDTRVYLLHQARLLAEPITELMATAVANADGVRGETKPRLPHLYPMEVREQIHRLLETGQPALAPGWTFVGRAALMGEVKFANLETKMTLRLLKGHAPSLMSAATPRSAPTSMPASLAGLDPQSFTHLNCTILWNKTVDGVELHLVRPVDPEMKTATMPCDFGVNLADLPTEVIPTKFKAASEQRIDHFAAKIDQSEIGNAH